MIRKAGRWRVALWMAVLLASMFGAFGLLHRVILEGSILTRRADAPALSVGGHDPAGEPTRAARSGVLSTHPAPHDERTVGGGSFWLDVPWHVRLWMLLLTSFLFFAYLLYLHSMAEYQLFSRPIEETFSAGFVPLVLLLAAYTMTCANIIWRNAQPVSYLVFCGFYVANAVTHILHMRRHRDAISRREKIVQGVWVGIDLASGSFFLAASLSYMFDNHWLTDPKYYGVTFKDGVIVVSAAFYQIVRAVQRYTAHDDMALHYAELIRGSVAGEVVPQGALKSACTPLAGKPSPRVLDLGSASSDRSLDLLERHAGLNLKTVSWCSFDHVALFKQPVDAQGGRLSEIQFVTTLVEAVDFSKTCDAIVLSHANYTAPLTQVAIECVKAMRPGALVIMRGIGPGSVFAAPFELRATALNRPGTAHLWNTLFLDALRDATGIVPAVERKDAARDKYNTDGFVGYLEHGYRAEAGIHGFVRSLSLMYGEATARVFDRLLGQFVQLNRAISSSPALNAQAGKDSEHGAAPVHHTQLLPSGDLLYVFKVSPVKAG